MTVGDGLRAVIRVLAAAALLGPVEAEAQVAFQSAGTFQASTGACTPGLPAAVAANDVLILVVETANQAITAPAGYTQIAAGSPQSIGNAGTAGAAWIGVFWKRAGASETAPTITDPGTQTLCQLYRFSGASTNNPPVDVSAGTSSGTSTTTGTIPGATTTTASTLVFLVMGTPTSINSTARCTGATNGNLTAITERSDNWTTTGVGGGFCAFTANYAGPGGYGSTSVTLATASTKVAIGLALTPAPTTPGTPTAASITASGFTASWAASSYTTSYTLQVDDASSFAAPLTASYGPVSSSQAVTGLASNTTYYLRVSATGSGGTSAYSGTGQALTLPGAPTAPTFSGLGQTGVTVSSTSPGGTGLTYRFQQSTGGGPYVDVTGCIAQPTPACTVTGLTPGTTYAFQVLAGNATGLGTASPAASVITFAAPGTPGTPAFSGVTSSSLTATWATSATGTAPITYALQRNDSGTWTPVCTGSGLATCNVAGLAANTSYAYRVVATNAYGSATSGTSSQLTLPGASTLAGYAGVTSSSVTVNWTAPPGGTAILTYDVQRASAAAGPFTNVAACQGVSATTCTDATVTAGNTYWYRVQAANGAGTGAWATATQVTTPASTLTLADGTNQPSGSFCPAASAPVDAFTLQASAGTVNVTGVTVSLAPAGAYQHVAAVQVACGATSGSASGPASDIVPVTLTASVSVGSASATACTVTLTAKAHAALAAGNLPVQARVTGVSGSGFVLAGSDASAGFTIDHAPPAPVTALVATAGDAQLQLGWAIPPADHAQTIVVQKLDTAVTFAPAPGSAYGVGPTGVAGETIVYAGGGTSHLDTPLVNARRYHYAAIARDACNNWSAAATTTAVPLAFIAEGDAAALSVKPVAAIVNPAKGAVVGIPFRIQARVFSPRTAGGTPQAVTGVSLLVDGQASAFTVTQNKAYGTAPGSGIWETKVDVGGLSAGSHTLRVSATNASGTVYSATVPITVSGARGDGNLLVRDNASQLCTDCHALAAHSSEATGNKWGSWATVCRDCHTPHGTRNVGLVAPQITPPARTAPTAAKAVVFQSKSGYAAGSFASPPASGANGPCQVCHTQTDYFRADGTRTADHGQTANCAQCHSHAKGFGAVCTDCHGDAARAKAGAVVGGVDTKLTASPPIDTLGSAVGVKVGAHEAHVNKGTYRANGLACADCHPWPNKHNGTRDAGWSALATGGGQLLPAPAATVSGNPATGYTDGWEASPSCTNWCHGAGLAGGGGTNTAPGWTAGASHAACGTCHASPPPVDATAAGDHPQNASCSSCHGADYAQASIGPAAKATHIDGTVQKPANGCTACHGKLAGLGGLALGNTSPAAAPGYDALSVDTRGSTDRAQVGVGAHLKHVNDGLMAGKACSVCHPLPADGDTTHANGGATQMSWSSPATAAGVAPTYTAPTCTNYCHSSGEPLGAAALTKRTVTWTSTAALGCSDCHATGAGMATNAHVKHVATYGIGCQACHGGTTADGASIVVGGGQHVNGLNDVTFSSEPVWAPFVQGGSYDTVGHTCGSTYCHSNGTKTASPFAQPVSAALPWTGADTCTSCHGGALGAAVVIGVGAGNGSATHRNHVANAAVLGANYACGDCHQATVTAPNDTALTGLGAHVDGQKTISIRTRGGFASADTTGTCSATYCHSSGQATPQYASVTWGTAWTNACNGCHGTSRASGAPDYLSGAAGSATANSHAAHTQAGASNCASCHAETVVAGGGAISAAFTPSRHTDGQRQVVFSGLAGSPTYTAGGATPKTCSSVACHGNNPVQWGAKIGCRGCHGAQTTAATDDDDDDYTFTSITSPGTLSKIDLDEWAANGHGATAAQESGNAAPDLDTGGTTDGCAYCHDVNVGHGSAGNFFRLANVGAGATIADKIGVCTKCHDGGGGYDPDGAGPIPAKTATKQIGATHYGLLHGATRGGQLCWDCHDPHGDRSGSNRLAFMIQKRPVRTHADAAGVATEWGLGSALFAATPDVRRATGTSATAWDWGDYVRNNGTGTAYNGVCQVCHTTTSRMLANGSTWAIDSGHNVGQRCTGCHGHNLKPTDAFKGAESRGNVKCGECHKYGMISGGDNVEPTRTQAYHHVMSDDVTLSGTPALTDYPSTATPAVGSTQKTCAQCHVDHNVFRPDINTLSTGRANNLRGSITANGLPRQDTSLIGSTLTSPVAPGALYRNSDADTAVPTTGVCVSCHTSAQAKDGTNQKADGTTQTYALNATTFGGSAHSYTVGGGTVARFQKDQSSFQNNCVKCHNSDVDATPAKYQDGSRRFMLHASPDRRLRAALGQSSLADDQGERFCYRCHSTAANGTALGGVTKGAVNQDWYGVVTSMTPASQDTFNAMQGGTAGSPALTNPPSDTLYFKPTGEDGTPPASPTNNTQTALTSNVTTYYLRSVTDTTYLGLASPPTAFLLTGVTGAGSSNTYWRRTATIASSGTAGTEEVRAQTVTTVGYVDVAQWVTPAFGGATSWGAGVTATLTIDVDHTATSGLLRFAAYKSSGGTITQIGGTGTSATLTGTGRRTVTVATIAPTTAVALAAGDAILFEIDGYMTSPGTMRFYWGNDRSGSASKVTISGAGLANVQPDRTTNSATAAQFGRRMMAPTAAVTPYETFDASGLTLATATGTSASSPATQYWSRLAWLSPAVNAATTLAAGTWGFSVYARASNAAANAHVRYRVNVTDATGATVKSTVIPWTTDSAVFASTAPPGGLVSFNASTAASTPLAVDDRIVVELEVETHDVTAPLTNVNLQYFFGTGAVSSVRMPSAVPFTYTRAAVTASGRHDVASYSGLHRPNPAEEIGAYLAANKHVECEDCHDPHAAKAGRHSGNTAGAVLTGAAGVKPEYPSFVTLPAWYPKNTAATAPMPTTSQAGDVFAGGTWGLSGASNSVGTMGTSIGTTTQQSDESVTTAGVWRHSAWISPAMTSAGAIPAGDWALQIGASATTTGVARLRPAIYVWRSNNTLGPVIASATTAAGTISTSTTTRYAVTMPGAQVAIGVGDRVVVEVNVESTGNAGTVTLRFDNSGSTGANTVVTPPVPMGSSWASPSSYTTVRVDPAGTDKLEAYVCLKCHSSSNPGVTSWGGSGAAAFTDLALEFNPGNESYHPVLQALPSTGNRRLAAAALTGGWTPGSVMACSDCHGTDSAASRGPHGSGVKWMLNPNTTGTKYYSWPYVSAADNGKSTGTLLTGTGGSTVPTGNFCFSCHLWSGGGEAHTNEGSNHAVSCVGCHIRVPHGGKVLRLLTGPSAPARYKPNGTGTGTTYMDGGVRPASGTMNSGNCNNASGCNEHNAGGQTW